jgi:hypothetical protein
MTPAVGATHTIRKTAGQLLHFEEITQRALARKLIAPHCHTLKATMASQRVGSTEHSARQRSRPHRPATLGAATNRKYISEDS